MICLPLFLSLELIGQRRTPQKTSPPTQAVRGIDYSKFSHSTPKHKQACDTCHRLPTNNWKNVRPFPDVADYPDHEACVRCHRSQFFKGARPAICSVCHTKVSPRDDARFAFRKPDSLWQFAIDFPHDKHQDVIARLKIPSTLASTSLRAFAHPNQDQTKNYNNCTICHATRARLPVPPPAGWTDNFVPTTARFKSSPDSHGSCFNCHWKAQQPTGNNCGGCHKLAETPFKPDNGPRRISIKFRHDREQHIGECTTCHINITKAATLRGLKPDVPITSCTECHNKDGLRLDVSQELEAVDKNPEFACVYCHTSNVGRRDAPSGHYLIAGRQPLKRRESK